MTAATAPGKRNARMGQSLDPWAQVPQYALRHPWFEWAPVTPETEQLASVIDGGGLNLIADVEGN